MKCAPSWGPLPWTSSSVGMELAVVSQRPGSWGASAFGRIGIEVGNGIWRDRDMAGLKSIWAIREAVMLLYRVDMAFARLDRDIMSWYNVARFCFSPVHMSDGQD